jgi:hypothetical protein
MPITLSNTSGTGNFTLINTNNNGGFLMSVTSPKNGLTPESAGDSAYQIKNDFPSSTDGLYWIKNNNINGGAAFQIYADMTTNGGGWTLIMQNNYNGGTWNQTNALLKNEITPPSTLANGIGSDDTQDYSIIQWADYIKSSPSGFQYMLDAYQRRHYGGIWQANENYSFTGSVNVTEYINAGYNEDGSSAYFGTPNLSSIISGSNGFRQNITEILKFPLYPDGTWDYTNDGLESRMPWYSTYAALYVGNAVITTTHNDDGSWWGTLITDNGWSPTPWMASYGMADPGVVWYWVR